MVTGFANMPGATLLLMIRSTCNRIFFRGAYEEILDRTHLNTSDFLKASMVAPLADKL